MADVRSHSEPTMEEILASIRRIIAEDEPPPPAAPAPLPQRPPMPETAPRNYVPLPPQSYGSATRPSYDTTPPLYTQDPSSMPPQDVLDLTDRIDEEEPLRRPSIGMAPPSGGAPPPLGPSGNSRMNRPPPLKTGATPQETPRRMAEPSPSVAASIATLQHLAGMGQSGRQQELPLGDVGRTLEEMVRELMRPHLKEWLDAHLPRLVERMVRDEINRLVRDAQER